MIIRRFLTTSSLLLMLSADALAVDVPSSSRSDNRIQYVNYSPANVVLIRTQLGRSTRVVFAPGEEIVEVSSGFTEGWEFHTARNILYVKAKSVTTKDDAVIRPNPSEWDTNIMVTTNLRMYDFDIKLLPERSKESEQAAYRIEFRYPVQDREKRFDEEKKRKIQEKLHKAPVAINWHYSMQKGDNSDMIAPTMAYDDGRFTYLRFSAQGDFPAAFLVSSDKSESLINSHIDPSERDVLVLHRVAPEFVLRLGSAVVGVYNENYSLHSTTSDSGTTSPDVLRVTKPSESE